MLLCCCPMAVGEAISIGWLRSIRAILWIQRNASELRSLASTMYVPNLVLLVSHLVRLYLFQLQSHGTSYGLLSISPVSSCWSCTSPGEAWCKLFDHTAHLSPCTVLPLSILCLQASELSQFPAWSCSLTNWHGTILFAWHEVNVLMCEFSLISMNGICTTTVEYWFLQMSK